MILPMQVMRLLATSAVAMAIGAIISLTFALVPPLRLPPRLPEPIDAKSDVVSQSEQAAETVGAAIADNFERRWQAFDDTALIPPRDPLRGLIGGVPLTHDAGKIAVHDLLYKNRGPHRLVKPGPLSTDMMSGSMR
jgi:hypothetical protein